MKKITFLILILLLSISCNKEKNTGFESGILWKIESKNGIESFIFGTVHLYPKNELSLSEKTISKLNKCNVLAIERNVTNQIEQKKFSDFEMPNFLLESYGVIVKNYGNELVSMESELIEKALSFKMKITGLESTKEILTIMKEIKSINVPEKTFIKKDILSNYQKNLIQYKTESIGDYHKSMTIQMGNEITKILVDKRNKNWIDNIESLIKKDNTFIAVGMGHLGGKNGLLNLLSEKGYELKPIK